MQAYDKSWGHGKFTFLFLLIINEPKNKAGQLMTGSALENRKSFKQFQMRGTLTSHLKD
jgi:hypothetical protein